MALDGRGVAWLPLILIAEDLTDGHLVAADGPELSIDLVTRLLRSQATAPSAAENFWRKVAGTGA